MNLNPIKNMWSFVLASFSCRLCWAEYRIVSGFAVSYLEDFWHEYSTYMGETSTKSTLDSDILMYVLGIKIDFTHFQVHSSNQGTQLHIPSTLYKASSSLHRWTCVFLEASPCAQQWHRHSKVCYPRMNSGLLSGHCNFFMECVTRVLNLRRSRPVKLLSSSNNLCSRTSGSMSSLRISMTFSLPKTAMIFGTV